RKPPGRRLRRPGVRRRGKPRTRGGAMRDGCDAGMRCADADACDAECHVTGRYGTERKSRQDMGEIPSVPDRSTPVDNPESRLDQERIDEFIRLDQAGLSARQIAEVMHVTTRTVTRWRARFDRRHGTPA